MNSYSVRTSNFLLLILSGFAQFAQNVLANFAIVHHDQIIFDDSEGDCDTGIGNETDVAVQCLQEYRTNVIQRVAQ